MISDKSNPPLRKPTVNPAPIAPIKLKLAVPTAIASIIATVPDAGSCNSKANNGDKMVNGNPVNSQCANVFANTCR